MFRTPKNRPPNMLLWLAVTSAVLWVGYIATGNSAERVAKSIKGESFIETRDAAILATPQAQSSSGQQLEFAKAGGDLNYVEGLRFQYGLDGNAKNYREALRFFRASAEKWSNLAYFKVGLFNDFGWGVEKNESEAIKWYKLAAIDPQELKRKADDERKRQAAMKLRQQEEAAEQKHQKELALLRNPTSAAAARQSAIGVQNVDAELIAKMNDLAVCALQEIRTLQIVDTEVVKRGLKCTTLMERL